ncbi:MAG: dynamin family protein [Planctomycetota bacterium]|jgi:GTPase SAR1 family protein|nr:dynamin family protein [Planctomycetota bacterium]
MKKVFIKYNPYKLTTEIRVDGKNLAENSKLGEKSADGSHLQEWVEELPQILVDEYNDTEFGITFHGTLLDCEDLKSVLTEAQKRGGFTAKLERQPAKETADKEKLIKDVFQEIQQGPFEELKNDAIISAFQHAQSKDFEVCVVATMSAGKSTLINAMLGTKLMPSKQEACTAIITRIKDISCDKIAFKAEVHDKDGNIPETHADLTYPTMVRLNSDEKVSEIKVSGNIPFVSAEDVSLVLIDTPGPNNARDERHRKVQSELLSKSSKALVLYIMTGEFGTDDDNALLKRVADSMAVGGKQSKDRFIFVVNKLDDRKEDDGNTDDTLTRVRSYLQTHGVANPNLFPASALPALNIRLLASGAEVDDDTKDETKTKVKKLNRNASLHFESFAPLPPSILGEIKGQLENTKSGWQGAANENPDEALIHTGIVSIEAAIRQYIQKYAKTAKIKNIVETFTHELDAAGCFEETKRELAKNREESKRIVKQINDIRQKIDDAQDAMKFEKAVNEAVAKVNDDSKKVVEKIEEKFQKRITQRIDELRGKEIDANDVNDEVNALSKFVQQLAPDFEVELDALIRDNLVKTSAALFENYKKKLASLTEDIDLKNISGVTIDPLKLMGGSVAAGDFSTEPFIKEKKVKDGTELIGNPDKAWYKPWTWWDEQGYYRDKYKNAKYVSGDELAQAFLRPITKNLYDNGDAACQYTLKQSKRIAEYFKEKFKLLDEVLKAKLAELESFATDEKKAEERVKASESKLKWLEEIKKQVESILEI